MRDQAVGSGRLGDDDASDVGVPAFGELGRNDPQLAT